MSRHSTLIERLEAAKEDPIHVTPDPRHGDVGRIVYRVEVEDMETLIALVKAHGL